MRGQNEENTCNFKNSWSSSVLKLVYDFSISLLYPDNIQALGILAKQPLISKIHYVYDYIRYSGTVMARMAPLFIGTLVNFSQLSAKTFSTEFHIQTNCHLIRSNFLHYADQALSACLNQPCVLSVVALRWCQKKCCPLFLFLLHPSSVLSMSLRDNLTCIVSLSPIYLTSPSSDPSRRDSDTTPLPCKSFQRTNPKFWPVRRTVCVLGDGNAAEWHCVTLRRCFLRSQLAPLHSLIQTLWSTWHFD